MSKLLWLLLLCVGLMPMVYADVSTAPEGWETKSIRDETRPDFSYDPKGGPDKQGAFIMKLDNRNGLDGRWVKTFAVKG